MRYKFRPWCDLNKEKTFRGGMVLKGNFEYQNMVRKNHGKTGLSPESQRKYNENSAIELR